MRLALLGAIVLVLGGVLDERSAVAMRAASAENRVERVERLARERSNGSLPSSGRMWLRM